ncbi:MAG: hypothetical protein QW546_00005 [Candidatus Bathyarchaeia archaeon]
MHLLQRETFIFQADIAEVWGEYQRLVEKAEFDSKGRTVVKIRWIIGKEGILPMTTLRKTILLKRDPKDNLVLSKLSPEELPLHRVG